MIYLFSQIAISLVLAAIVGGAIGWLIHRVKAAKQHKQLQQIVARQQQQVNEAQSEVSILTADFDDLKQTSDSKISQLKKENLEIPSLNQNLEKSQLLVRQLMEQHKTELDELTEENDKLLVKSRQVDDHESEITKLQAELDIERRKSARLATDNEASAATGTSGTNSTPKASTQNLASASASTTPASTASTSTRLPLSGNSVPTNSSETSDAETSDAETSDAESSNTKVETAKTQIADSNDDTLPNADQTASELKEIRDQLAEETPTSTGGLASSSNFVEVSPELTNTHKLVETEVDDANLEQMFDTVEQHDDLKQIFGIGPVTEKTLNKLGITAYAQLAELKQHDIEKIANALQIFPGRIERDNWVGGARAQLEEVLEDL